METPGGREGIERMLDEESKPKAAPEENSRASAVALPFGSQSAESKSALSEKRPEAGRPAAQLAGPAGIPLFQPPPEPPARSSRPDETRETSQGGDSTAPPASRNRNRQTRGQQSAGQSGSDSEGSGSAVGRKTSGAGKPSDAGQTEDADKSGEGQEPESEQDTGGNAGRRRRRRRRPAGGNGEATGSTGASEKTEPSSGDEVASFKGSTRLEAKKQRRREGRESGRRRAPVLTEAEFLARRESVRRGMIVRQRGRVTQIAVLEDGIMVEHYVNRATVTSLVGNVFLGKVQNVLPSMEAAFVDIGRGRNAVLYAGEVNWDAAGLEGQAKRIEQALSSGDNVLVQVTKDPVGHKGARLTSQVSLPGRFLVLVPDGSMTGISRKLPDQERARLRSILKTIVPEGSGVIVRTAAEGVSEEDLARDISQLSAAWDRVREQAETAVAPAVLHSEPDLALRVVRDIFNSDFESLVVSGDEVWRTLHDYVSANAPGLLDRVSKWTEEADVFKANRVDEQLSKALDRKVWLPSGGSLVIDKTEAMTVVDVNTGRFTGQGGNLEETVTKNNLEAAEEIVRQIRLRDIGGIIVIDFIDMVLESNRNLVLRRMVECLGRDRTKHQVAEVTSLGLIQMTRKRIGQGLLETFSEPCEVCDGRGVKVHSEPVEQRNRTGRGRSVRPQGAHDPTESVRRDAESAVTETDKASDSVASAQAAQPAASEAEQSADAEAV